MILFIGSRICCKTGKLMIMSPCVSCSHVSSCVNQEIKKCMEHYLSNIHATMWCGWYVCIKYLT